MIHSPRIGEETKLLGSLADLIEASIVITYSQSSSKEKSATHYVEADAAI
jgi:hypothetical protein